MTTISFVSTKGGVGKSTLTWITACALAHNYGKQVVVIDADLQLSLSSTAASIDNLPFKVISASLTGIYDVLNAIEDECDVALIDMPGILHTPDGSREGITDFLFFVDVMLLPLKAHSFDVLNVTAFQSVISEVVMRRKSLDSITEVAYFINDLHSKKSAREVERHLVSDNMPMLGRNLSRSVSIERSVISADSLLNSPSVSPKIKIEFKHFMDSIIKLL
jgi:cellulose biosynthesis protein BcsQ